MTHYCLSNKLEHMLPGRWKDPSNGQDPNLYKNTELEEAMRLIAIADKDWQPLSDEVDIFTASHRNELCNRS